MNVLITGGTGFLGRRTAEKLRAAGVAVTVVGRNATMGEALVASLGCHFIRADLADARAVRLAVDGHDAVLHCAAKSSPWGPYREFHRANVLGTQHVIAACEAVGVGRLVHVSTPSVYFDFRDRTNIRETDPLPRHPANHYVKTKLAAEKLVSESVTRGVPAVILRPRGIFGPGDTTLVPRLIRANARGMLPLCDGGENLIDITYVDNVADALIAAIHAAPRTIGRVYNITNGEPRTLREILALVFAKLGVPFAPRHTSFRKMFAIAGAMEWFAKTIFLGREPVLTRYTVGVLAKSQTLDISRARADLGYSPAIGIDEGISRFVAWWKETNP